MGLRNALRSFEAICHKLLPISSLFFALVTAAQENLHLCTLPNQLATYNLLELKWIVCLLSRVLRTLPLDNFIIHSSLLHRLISLSYFRILYFLNNSRPHLAHMLTGELCFESWQYNLNSFSFSSWFDPHYTRGMIVTISRRFNCKLVLLVNISMSLPHHEKKSGEQNPYCTAYRILRSLLNQ